MAGLSSATGRSGATMAASDMWKLEGCDWEASERAPDLPNVVEHYAGSHGDSGG